MKEKSENSLTIPVAGMTCSSCANTVRKGLERCEGVLDADVNYTAGTATLSLEGEPPSISELADKVRKSGYELPTVTVELSVPDMDSPHCEGVVRKAIEALPGVARVQTYTGGRVEVKTVEEMTGRAELLAAVRAAGYTPSLASAQTARRTEEKAVAIRLLVGAPFTLALLAFWLPGLHFAGYGWLLLGLAVPVQFYTGWPFLKGAWGALRMRTATMDTLVALGTLAAFTYSVVALLFPNLFTSRGLQPDYYFETAAVILELILLGKWLEHKTRGKASEAVEKLLSRMPAKALVEREGELVELPADQLVVGDIFHVRPGQSIPADGEVVSGESDVDESAVTGEPVPVPVTEGSSVTGGTQNTTGALRVRATRVGADTTFARIVNVVKEAQASKAPVQKIADQVSGWFVYGVMLIAVITVVIWALSGAPTAGFIRAVAVLVVACPCALGLATPISIIVGVGKGAERGVLIRGGESLEKIKGLSVAAFDKTGTLTVGRPAVTDVLPVKDGSEAELLRAAVSAETPSEHPIAKAIVDYGAEHGATPAPVEEFRAVIGEGVSALLQGKEVLVGKPSFAGAPTDYGPARTLEEQAKTVFYVSVGGRFAGVIAVRDELKPGAKESVAALKKMGLEPLLVTGDAERSGRVVADSLGIERVEARVTPEGKADIIEKLQKAGNRVAFVGDGINDAPALAVADLAVAMGTGTDVAVETGDIVLMKGDIAGLVKAVKLVRAVYWNIRQNLFWAFAYNIMLLPLAAGVLVPLTGWSLSPIFAAAAMGLSSVSVVSNALRLRLVRI